MQHTKTLKSDGNANVKLTPEFRSLLALYVSKEIVETLLKKGLEEY
jgi:hypothetical protein